MKILCTIGHVDNAESEPTETHKKSQKKQTRNDPTYLQFSTNCHSFGSWQILGSRIRCWGLIPLNKTININYNTNNISKNNIMIKYPFFIAIFILMINIPVCSIILFIFII